MAKRFFRRYIPTPEKVREIRSLRFLGQVLHEPNLWHINRHAVARAFMVGIFWTLIPMPFQSIPAAIMAIWLNANLPLTLALIWISNPITMGPIMYGTYVVGTWILGQPAEVTEFKLQWAWFSERLIEVGIPLYVGAIVLSVSVAVMAYLIIQYLWRRKVRSDWHKRQQARRQRQQ